MLRLCVVFLVCLLPHAVGGSTCYRGTACAAKFSKDGHGCCVYENGVCCPNQQTCCPQGNTCEDNGPYLTTCVPKSGPKTPGKSVCKFGPALPFSTTLKNVIIMGDSVSIGYTPVVAELLKDVALVQHSPWDTSDGGAEETAYGLQCLDFFVRSPEGKVLSPDVLMFNWGLHDGPLGNSTIPGQQGNESVYEGELEEITTRLQEMPNLKNTKLLFALTSPMLCNLAADYSVIGLNKMAAPIMEKHSIPTFNLHDAIVGHCGPVPQKSCFNHTNCFCPHCPGAGYQWVAENVVGPAIKKLL